MNDLYIVTSEIAGIECQDLFHCMNIHSGNQASIVHFNAHNSVSFNKLFPFLVYCGGVRQQS